MNQSEANSAARSLGDAIEAGRGEIESRWLQRVLRDVSGAPGVEITDLRNGIPDYLSGLVSLLSGDTPKGFEQNARHVWSKVASEHGVIAEETAAKKCPDIMILDWNLDGITAEEVLRQLRQDIRTAKLPVLLISGMAEGELQARLYSVDEFLRKPFNGEQLVRSVDEMLSRVAHPEPTHGSHP